MHKKFIILFLAVFIFASSFVAAATYYVCDNAIACNANSSGWVTGNDANSCSSKSFPCNTIRAGILKMVGGDTLIVGDGVYTGAANRIYGMPSGSASAYTKIHAENDWGVTLNNTSAGDNDHQEPVNIQDKSYVIVQGFHLTGSLTAHSHYEVYASNHIKIIRCSSSGVYSEGYSFVAEEGSTYVLFEECYSYGPGRYPFEVGGVGITRYIVFRRCIVRWDYSRGTEPQACFNAYDVDHVYWQNCIVIDGKDNTANPGYAYGGLHGFFNANGGDNYGLDGCIVLNFEGAGFYYEMAPISNINIQNCVSWDIKYPGPRGYPATPFCSEWDATGSFIVSRCTFGNSSAGNGLLNYQPQLNFKDSIVYGLTNLPSNLDLDGAFAMGGHYYSDRWTNEDYNCLYGNTRNKAIALGSHDITATNPLTNGLLYIPRIETGSTLKTAGQSGSQIGAEIIYKTGVSGTLYGESGWNTLTSEPLWPFPNEAQIKQEVASFHKTPGEAYSGSPEMNGARGFAASGNGLYGGPITLTSYIWEYLGNACPADICNYNIQYHAADTNQNNIIEMRELIAFIARWKAGQANVADVLSALDRWMRGS